MNSLLVYYDACTYSVFWSVTKNIKSFYTYRQLHTSSNAITLQQSQHNNSVIAQWC